jgi:Na+/phosphate symporter
MSGKTAITVREDRRDEISGMGVQAVEMLKIARESFVRQTGASLEAADRLGHEIHQRQVVVLERMLSKDSTVGRGAAGDHIFAPMHFERVGDNLESLIHSVRTMIQDGILFTDRATREIRSLLDIAIELVQCVTDAVQTGNGTLIRHVLEEGSRYEAMADEFARFHEQRLIEGVCRPRASSAYLAMVDYLKGVEWHTRQIAQKLAATLALDIAREGKG